MANIIIPSRNLSYQYNKVNNFDKRIKFLLIGGMGNTDLITGIKANGAPSIQKSSLGPGLYPTGGVHYFFHPSYAAVNNRKKVTIIYSAYRHVNNVENAIIYRGTSYGYYIGFFNYSSTNIDFVMKTAWSDDSLVTANLWWPVGTANTLVVELDCVNNNYSAWYYGLITGANHNPCDGGEDAYSTASIRYTHSWYSPIFIAVLEGIGYDMEKLRNNPYSILSHTSKIYFDLAASTGDQPTPWADQGGSVQMGG